MKNLIVSLAIGLSAVVAQAVPHAEQFPTDVMSVSPISGVVASVSSAVPNCPATAMCEMVTVLKVNFTLRGCMNQIGPVTYTSERAADGKLDVYVSAVEIVRRASLQVMCLRSPVATAEMTLGLGVMGADDVRVHFLSGTARTVVQ